MFLPFTEVVAYLAQDSAKRCVNPSTALRTASIMHILSNASLLFRHLPGRIKWQNTGHRRQDTGGLSLLQMKLRAKWSQSFCIGIKYPFAPNWVEGAGKTKLYYGDL